MIEGTPDTVIHATGDLFPRLLGVDSQGGVAMNPPPAGLMATIQQDITAVMAGIPPDGRGRLVAIATKTGDKVSTNLAIAAKHQVGDKVEVKIGAWLGKSWGQPVAVGVLGGIDF